MQGFRNQVLPKKAGNGSPLFLLLGYYWKVEYQDNTQEAALPGILEK
ncbi:hypothetical protein [Lunatimonas salinarum]|nr:hypothetical protein [Lunatimonas salinarum]